ncbi:MAG TPA: YtxH domain-containing protein [Acidisarcina sp.]
MNAVKFWTVFSIGVAAGAAVALIYAPDTGVETRRKIKSSIDDATDYVKDATAPTVAAVKEATAPYISQAQDVIARGKTAVSDAVDSASSAAASANAATRKKVSEYV